MTVDQRDPESVVRAAAVAMHEERWPDVAALCSAEALRAYQESQVSVLRDHMRILGEGMQRELARAGVVNLDELAALDPAELYARWLAARSPRRRNGAMLDAVGAPARVRAWFDEHVPRHPMLVVLGHVREGERHAHVVVREQHAEPPAAMSDGRSFAEVFGEVQPLIHASTHGPVRLVTLERADDGRWWLQAGYDLLGFGEGLGAWSAEHFVSRQEAAEWEGEPPDD